MVFDRLAKSFRRRLLGISSEAIRCARRGFRVDEPSVRERLEGIGGTFVLGYHLALDDPRPEHLAKALESVRLEDRGFAFEGAAMALALLDVLTPWRRDRLTTFLVGPGDPHSYMVHVGAGWALARMRRSVSRTLDTANPMLRWMIVDGYGFHEGYFRTRRSVEQRVVPKKIQGYARRAFDQGLGRSLWFVEGADPSRIARTIRGFTAARHADLWSGVGLAAAYAGGIGADGIQALTEASGPFRADLAQGVAFAAKARERAGNPAAHTELASQLVCGGSADFAASVTDEARLAAVESTDATAFEDWRSRIRDKFAGGVLA